MIQYIEACSDEVPLYKSIFLAGGISNCPDWQTEAVTAFKDRIEHLLSRGIDYNLTIINPRRKDFDTSKIEESRKQIEWEYKMLGLADTILFWFPKETLCPITLFELGIAMGKGKSMAIGCHPEYARKFDLEIQCDLQNPGTHIFDNIDAVAHLALLML